MFNSTTVVSLCLPRILLSNYPNRFLITTIRGTKKLWPSRPIKFTAFSSHPGSVSPCCSTDSTFTWDDVLRVSQPEYAPFDSSDLSGFFDKIASCNRGNEMQLDFVQFSVCDQIVGYIHRSFAERLRRFEKVFRFVEKDLDGCFYISVNAALETPEERTTAIAEVIKCLGEEGLIPGIRNELYPVTMSYGGHVFFSLERAAAPYFGIKAYGVHMNGFVEKDGRRYLWIGRRSEEKPTYPGKLDHLVAGGLASGMSCWENLVRECDEEAGIPLSVSHEAIPAGAVSYLDIDGHRYKRDVLFCYDLKLPESFVPTNQDGEVESFKLIPVTNVANVIKRTHYFKANCNLVIMDFLFRHGFIAPECQGYLNLLCSLRRGDCS